MTNFPKLVCLSLDMRIIDKLVWEVCKKSASHIIDGNHVSGIFAYGSGRLNFDKTTKLPRQLNQARTGATKKCGRKIVVFINGNKSRVFKGTWD